MKGSILAPGPARKIWERDGQGRLHLQFHAGQQRAYESERRFVFVLAGTQSGKTGYGPWWLAREIERRGGGDYLAVTATYDLFKMKMLPMLRETFEQVLGSGRYWAGDKVLEIREPATRRFWASRAGDPMWARIILRSAAAGGGLEAASAQAAWLDECGQDEFTVETWEAVLRRLSLSQGRVLGTTTPYNLGWIKTEVHDRWEAGDPDIDVVQFPSTWNPAFSPEEFARAERTMPGWRFRMFYHGELTRPAGLIYDCFDPEENVVDDFHLPYFLPRRVGIDFGAVNTALVWIAEDPQKGVFYAYRESLEGGKSTEEHVRAARRAAGRERVVLWIGGSPSEEQQRMDWAQAGLSVIPPYVGDVDSGLDRVYGLIKTRRLLFFRSMTGLLDEIGSYRRRLDEQGEPTGEIVDKRRYHRLDALRYAATALTQGKIEWGPALW